VPVYSFLSIGDRAPTPKLKKLYTGTVDRFLQLIYLYLLQAAGLLYIKALYKVDP
jgi:hypothetical protein